MPNKMQELSAVLLLRSLVNVHAADVINVTDIQQAARNVLKLRPDECGYFMGVKIPDEFISVCSMEDDVPVLDELFDMLGQALAEMHRQNRKWGAQRNHNPIEWGAILNEEVGEAAKDIVEGYFTGDPNKRKAINARLVIELIQVAAVAMQAAASIKRQYETKTNKSGFAPRED